MNRNLKYYWIMVPVVVGLLAACATAQTQTAAPAAAPTTAPTTVDTAATTAPPSAAAGTAAPAAGASSGIKFVLVPAKSSASYTVTEQLAGNNLPNDAVGKTSSITGSIIILPDGKIDTANSKFTVDVSTLQTDQSMRDNFVRKNVLKTDQYPLVVFVPTQVTGLPATLPQSGDVSFKITGDMTVATVVKPVTWDVTGTITNGEATGKAITSFTFEDFGLTPPHVGRVLSIVDKINLAVALDIQRAGN